MAFRVAALRHQVLKPLLLVSLSSLYVTRTTSFLHDHHDIISKKYTLLSSTQKFPTSSLTVASSSHQEAVEEMEKDDPVVELTLPSPIILGSASFTRKLILKEMGINYDIVVKSIDEKNIGDRENDKPSDLVLKIASAKANALVEYLTRQDSEIQNRKEGWIILTGDQVVTHDGDILEKPESVDVAKEYVKRYTISAPCTVGSCVLTHIPSMIQVSGVDTATIYFNSNLNVSLVDRLMEDNAPVLSCAGGLMVEHPFVRECLERIDGTEDSVMGLSKDLVLQLLKKMKDKLESR